MPCKAIFFWSFSFLDLRASILFYGTFSLSKKREKVLIVIQPKDILLWDLNNFTHRERGLKLSCILKNAYCP